MKRANTLFVFLLLTLSSMLFAQDYVRKVVQVPKVDPGSITIDGKMDEAAWQNAAHADILTTSGSEGWFNHYYDLGDALTEPDYKEIYGRMLWAKDTLYLFVHIQELVTDSTDLFFDGGKFNSDQLFVALSNRLGVDMQGWYDGNPYATPNGPYHFWVIGDQVTLNGGDTTSIPDDYICDTTVTRKVFNASDYERSAVVIDKGNGLWDVEMAIYNPNVNASAKIAFNLGGSNAQSFVDFSTDSSYQDHTYMYWTWQPGTPDEPFTVPAITDTNAPGDPGGYSLLTSNYWSILQFQPGQDDYVRTQVDVPMVDPGSIKIDGKMDEAAWQNAAHADVLTTSGSQGWFNHYYDLGDALTEPDYKEIYGRMLWAKDTLYVFAHIQELVTDSTDLFFDGGKFNSDQLFVALSNRLGVDMQGWYDGNPYAAPNGPYHYWVIGDQVTLNGGDVTGIPDAYLCDTSVSEKVFNASDFEHSAVVIDKGNGLWDVEMAIYHPNVALQASIGFNLGGSNAQSFVDFSTDSSYQDHTYMYWTWQPGTPDEPFTVPAITDTNAPGDPGGYSLLTSNYWPLLNFTSSITGIHDGNPGGALPKAFTLMQNFPNPFNPATTIRFQLAEKANITLKVYNVVGQVVATIVNNKEMGAGTYSLLWNASQFASGVYFYQLKAGNVLQTKKMILLK